MATLPSPAAASQGPKDDATKPPPANGDLKPNGTQHPKSGAKTEQEPGQEQKISGAEMKKRAKAEKAARREREKLERQGGAGPTPPSASHERKSEQQKSQSQAGKVGQKSQQQFTKEGGKAHHNRSDSTAQDTQRNLAVRTREIHLGPRRPEEKHVALFGHLYGHNRRTTVVGAGKEIHPAVLALGLQISNYVVCGSNARCVAMLLAFKRAIESYTTPPGNTLTRHLTSHCLSPQIDYLRSCRPLSISMGNAIRWLKLEVSKVDIDTPEAEAKADLCDAIDNFIRERITVADQVIASSAAAKIQNDDVILTFAKSSIVQQTLLEAHKKGTRFRVIVIDSRPLFEGKHLARALASAGVEVQYSLVHAINHAIKDATKVFLGAHAMMSNGRLYSRIGTAIAAMAAHEADVPVIVCCESVKFTEKVALDSIVNNEVAPPDELVISKIPTNSTQSEPNNTQLSSLSNWRNLQNLQLLNLMYDVTPAEYIKIVVTEYGSLPPSSVPVVHRLSTNT